jgi:hypothetical protein
MNFIFTIVGLFIVLSPGLLLTLPALTKTQGAEKGYSYGGTEDDPAGLCSSSTAWVDQDDCKKHLGIWTSNETTGTAVAVHTIVFAVALLMIQKQYDLGSYLSTSAVFVLSGLFALLSPGLIVTLPSLSKNECGFTGRKVADGDEYCNAITTITEAAHPNCFKCTSLWGSGFTSPVAIIVHGILFGLLAAWLTNNYLSNEMAM